MITEEETVAEEILTHVSALLSDGTRQLHPHILYKNAGKFLKTYKVYACWPNIWIMYDHDEMDLVLFHDLHVKELIRIDLSNPQSLTKSFLNGKCDEARVKYVTAIA